MVPYHTIVVIGLLVLLRSNSVAWIIQKLKWPSDSLVCTMLPRTQIEIQYIHISSLFWTNQSPTFSSWTVNVRVVFGVRQKFLYPHVGRAASNDCTRHIPTHVIITKPGEVNTKSWAFWGLFLPYPIYSYSIIKHPTYSKKKKTRWNFKIRSVNCCDPRSIRCRWRKRLGSVKPWFENWNVCRRRREILLDQDHPNKEEIARTILLTLTVSMMITTTMILLVLTMTMMTTMKRNHFWRLAVPNEILCLLHRHPRRQRQTARIFAIC